ncbi:DNA-binding protein [Curtobacterium sp. VKM Ac-2852]|nr:DNA-binding protein [Curtobacterium sp. VKM Ac-2852]
MQAIRQVEDLPEWSTRVQLSQFIEVSVQTLARWKVEGRGPRVTKIGQAVRYRKSDVLSWLDSLSEAS